MEVGPGPGAHERDLHPRQPPRWGLIAGVGMILGLVLSNLLAGIWLEATGEEELALGGLGVAQVGLWAGLLGACVYASRVQGSRRLADDLGLELRPVDLPIGLGVALAAQFVLLPVVALVLRPLLGHPDVSGPARDLADKADGVGIVGLVIFVAVLTPIVEELFFRGLVLRAIERRWGTAWGVAGSSLLFGLAHLPDVSARALVLVVVSLTLFGAMLALVVVKTRRLGAAIVAHALFNGWTLLVVLAIDP